MLLQSDFYTQVVDIRITFKTYEYTKHAFAICGEVWTELCSEPNSKELSLLLRACDD
jgi:hypothetical protein